MTTSVGRILSSTAAALLLAGLGCASNSAPGSEGSRSDARSVDAGSDTSIDKIVASVDISLEPARHVYTTESEITGSATVYDAQGETVDNPEVSWSIEPASSAEKLGPGTFKLSEEGRHTVRACATLQSGQEVCGTRKIVVDDSPPSIEIERPKPGAMVGGDANGTITVEGRVSDSHGDVAAYLNGERIELAPEGSFSTQLEPKFGVNTVRVVASDGVNQRNVVSRRQVLWAPGYASLETGGSEIGATFGDGIAFNIGQNYFDDAQTPTRSSNDSKRITKDFADILTLLASNLNLADRIPSPAVDAASARLEVDDVQLGSPDVTVDVTDTGLQAFLHIDNLVLDSSGEISLEGSTISLDGSVNARVSAFTELSVDHDRSNDAFEASVEEIDVSIDEITPNFNDQRASAIFELADSTVRRELESVLIDAVRQEVVETLPELISVQLNWLDKSLSSRSFEFGTEATGRRTVSFEADVQSFSTTFRRGMVGQFDSSLSTSGSDAHPMAPGIPLLDASLSKEVPWFRQSRVQMGIRVAMLNGMLTSLWKTGYLDLDLTEVLPDDLTGVVEKADLRTPMPPVLRPAQETETYDLIIEAGQVELTTKALQSTDTYGLHLRAGVNVALEDNRLKLKIPDKPSIDVWVIETSGDEPFLKPDGLKDLILTKFWPTLETSLSSGLSVYMPAPRIDELSRFAPSLSQMTLAYEFARPISVRDGYLLFDMLLRGTLPVSN